MTKKKCETGVNMTGYATLTEVYGGALTSSKQPIACQAHTLKPGCAKSGTCSGYTKATKGATLAPEPVAPQPTHSEHASWQNELEHVYNKVEGTDASLRGAIGAPQLEIMHIAIPYLLIVVTLSAALVVRQFMRSDVYSKGYGYGAEMYKKGYEELGKGYDYMGTKMKKGYNYMDDAFGGALPKRRSKRNKANSNANNAEPLPLE